MTRGHCLRKPNEPKANLTKFLINILKPLMNLVRSWVTNQSCSPWFGSFLLFAKNSKKNQGGWLWNNLGVFVYLLMKGGESGYVLRTYTVPSLNAFAIRNIWLSPAQGGRPQRRLQLPWAAFFPVQASEMGADMFQRVSRSRGQIWQAKEKAAAGSLS